MPRTRLRPVGSRIGRSRCWMVRRALAEAVLQARIMRSAPMLNMARTAWSVKR